MQEGGRDLLNALNNIDNRLTGLEAQTRAGNEGQMKVIFALIGCIAATLGIRFTETDFGGETMVAGSYLMVLGSTYILLMWLRERRRRVLSPSIGFLVLGLWGFGLPAMITGSFWLSNWMVGILRAILAVGMVWLGWDLSRLGREDQAEGVPE